MSRWAQRAVLITGRASCHQSRRITLAHCCPRQRAARGTASTAGAGQCWLAVGGSRRRRVDASGDDNWRYLRASAFFLKKGNDWERLKPARNCSLGPNRPLKGSGYYNSNSVHVPTKISVARKKDPGQQNVLLLFFDESSSVWNDASVTTTRTMAVVRVRIRASPHQL